MKVSELIDGLLELNGFLEFVCDLCSEMRTKQARRVGIARKGLSLIADPVLMWPFGLIQKVPAGADAKISHGDASDFG